MQRSSLLLSLATLLATVTAAPSSPKVAPVTINGTTDSSLVTCRAEPICLSQVCNPAAYAIALDNDPSGLPYTVNFTVTGSDTTTTFVFNVCSQNANATLSIFELRLRDDMLSTGQSLLASPQGTNWASCSPIGQGYVWSSTALGNLSVSNKDSCQAFTVIFPYVTGDPRATLKDVCQQNVTIIDNQGDILFDGTTLPPYCLYTLQDSNGNVGFGTLVQETNKPRSTTGPALRPAPAPYGSVTTKAGIAGNPAASIAAAPSASLSSKSTLATGPTPYGAPIMAMGPSPANAARSTQKILSKAIASRSSSAALKDMALQKAKGAHMAHAPTPTAGRKLLRGSGQTTMR